MRDNETKARQELVHQCSLLQDRYVLKDIILMEEGSKLVPALTVARENRVAVTIVYHTFLYRVDGH